MALTPVQVLDLPMDKNDSGASTIRGYLVALVAAVWEDGEGFSGKRPFGNSGWEGDIERALIKAGAVEGTLDEDGYIDLFPRESQAQARELVAAAIKSLAEPEADTSGT